MAPIFAPVAASWYRLMAGRITVLTPIKALGTTAFMALFFLAYFAVLRNPLDAPAIMPLTVLDTWIAFTPKAYAIYVSLWVYVSLPAAFFGNLRALLRFAAWIAGLCLFCLGIFWIFPTAVPAFEIDWSAHPELAALKGLDATGNACPSLHVATAVFAAFWLDRFFRLFGAPASLRWLSAAQCLLIVWSTVAIRQHVVLDAFAGIAVGMVFAVLSFRHIGQKPGDACCLQNL